MKISIEYEAELHYSDTHRLLTLASRQARQEIAPRVFGPGEETTRGIKVSYIIVLVAGWIVLSCI